MAYHAETKTIRTILTDEFENDTVSCINSSSGTTVKVSTLDEYNVDVIKSFISRRFHVVEMKHDKTKQTENDETLYVVQAVVKLSK